MPRAVRSKRRRDGYDVAILQVSCKNDSFFHETFICIAAIQSDKNMRKIILR